MTIIKPSVELLAHTMLIGDNTDKSLVKLLELAIRNCYKSEDKITDDSHERIISTILNNNHTSTLEHASFTFRIITSRDVLQELARHRIASYSVESTRYCNYGSEKKGMKFIQPAWLDDETLNKALEARQTIKDSDNNLAYVDESLRPVIIYLSALEKDEENYNKLLDCGWKPQQARVILAGNLKTEIILTMNIRSLMNFITLRTSAAAHPDMQVIAKNVANIVHKQIPLIFNESYDV